MTEAEKKLLEESNKTIKELQDNIAKADANLKSYEDKFKSLDSDAKEKLERIEKELTEKDSELQKKQIEMDKAAKEVREAEERIKTLSDKNTAEAMERIKELELVIAKGVQGSDKESYKKGEHYKALESYAKAGEGFLSDSEKKYLRTDVNSGAGFLVPTELYGQIMEEVEELDPMRLLSRVFSSKVKTLEVPVLKTLPQATYEGEAETSGNSQSEYRLEQLTAYAQCMNTPITVDMIEFSAYDMIAQMTKDAARGFAISEGLSFLKGTGKKAPEGLLTNTAVLAAAVQSATSGIVSLVDVIKLAGNLKAGYLANARYFMNQKSLFDLRAEKDGSGNFLWRVGGEAMPNNIAGIPYIIMPSMDNVAASSYSVGIGDFFYGYYILDAVGIRMIRDDVTLKKQRIVEFSWFKYNTGQVGVAEAFKLLKTKA